MKDEAFLQEKKYGGRSKGDVALEKISSLEYRRTGFKLALMGSDRVVRAYNELMQYIYNQTTSQSSSHTKILMNRLGDLLLEIRRSVGNQNTSLRNLEMLEWLINDIRNLQE
jgi:hypothetical protein